MTTVPVLEAREVNKQYPGTRALDHVTFRLHAGRVSALIGENGAGKSTLVKILGGVEQPSSGSLLFEGREIHLKSVRDADSHGIGMIHQELNLCPNLSVAENIFLGRELTQAGVWLNANEQCRHARELMERLEHPIDPDVLVGDLPLGQQQVVEIAKAVSSNVRVLMMDEPTSALSPAEIAVLFRLIRDLKSRGVAVVYISHRLEELLEIADEVTVLRDGKLVATAEASAVDTRWIVEKMTGRTDQIGHAAAEELLEIADEVTVLRDGKLVATADAGEVDTRRIVEKMTGRSDQIGPAAAEELLQIADEVTVLREGKLVATADAGEVDTRSIVEKMTGRSDQIGPAAAEELLEIADEVTVLRDGKLAATADAGEVDTRSIVEKMTGRSDQIGHAAADSVQGRVLLKAENWSLATASGRPLLRNVSLHVRAGEVLGIYGLMGAGRTELLECLMGLHDVPSGRLQLDSKPIEHLDTAGRIAAGLAMVPEDRQTSGLVQALSIRENIALASLRRFTRRMFLSRSEEVTAAGEMVTRLRIKAPGLEHNIGSLSGGNQQKVVIAKCLMTSPKVLLLDEPTRGVDVGAKREIYGIVQGLAKSGMGVVYVSSELEEVRAVADRIIVMSRGEVTGEFQRSDAAPDALAVAATAGLGARA